MSDTAAVVDVTLDPQTPLVTARLLLAEHRTPENDETIRLWNGSFYRWRGAAWREVEDEAMRREIYHFTEDKTVTVMRRGIPSVEPFNPNARKVSEILDALRSECLLPHLLEPPCWLDKHAQRPPANELLLCKNGLVHLPGYLSGGSCITPPTPLFFNLHALDFDFVPEAPKPAEWLAFLSTLWPDDPESITLLQEWFGYCLTCDTRQQKMALLYGPKRSGKGTIARVLRELLGRENIAGPTLSGLSTNFGLWPLIGKSLAIISDARLSGRADSSIVTERLLSISGEDALTIDRKNLPPLTVRLGTRIMLLTNELPKLADASGALASRFVVLRLTRSFYGHEDKGLTDRLLAELPGILLWAIDGWRRLREQGRFTEPASSQAAKRELDELGSPITAFVRDFCRVGAGHGVEAAALYAAWVEWCKSQGRERPGERHSFGRDLAAAVPGIRVTQPRVGDVRIRYYEGISLGRDPQADGENDLGGTRAIACQKGES
jgi:putative DNA primase/helicase